MVQLLFPAYYWVATTATYGVPPSAVHGGIDQDGTQIYVGRAFHEGDWIPAKVIPEKNVAYVAYDGKEVAKSEYQVGTIYIYTIFATPIIIAIPELDNGSVWGAQRTR